MSKFISPQIIPLVAMSLLAHVTLSGGRVASSLLVLDHGYSEAVAGLTYGLYGLMPALLSLHMGRLVDRVGPRRVMRLCLVAMAIGLALPAVDLSLGSVLACATLGGLGFGGYILAAHVSVSFMPVDNPSERTGMFAWLQMGTSISAVAGPALVGFIIDLRGFAMAYTCLAVIVIGGFVWSLWATIPTGETSDARAKGQGIVRDVIRDSALLRIYLLSMAVYLAWDCFAFMIPVLGTERGYSASAVGVVLSFFAVGTFIVRACQPWLSRKATEWRTLCVSYGVAAVVFALLPFAQNIVLLCAISLAFGMSAGVGHPNILNLILKRVGAHRSGEASGLRLMTGNLAGMMGTAGCGAIAAVAGVVPVFIGVGVVMVVSSWQAHRAENGMSTR